VDTSQELSGEELSYYQSQVGVLRWIVELGRIDIITEVSSLASCLALPRKGHLEAVFYLYAYLAKKTNGTVILDPTYPDIDLIQFNDGAGRLRLQKFRTKRTKVSRFVSFYGIRPSLCATIWIDLQTTENLDAKLDDRPHLYCVL
jgi:hypothetical protein